MRLGCAEGGGSEGKSGRDCRFILWANLPGFIMGSFYSITCFSRAEPSVRFKEELTYMGFLLGVTCPILFTAMFGPDRSEMRVSSGFTANACLFLYYASPLSTIAEVIRTKSAETLYWPMVLANGINGGSWTAYGAFLREPFVFVPNGAGALLAIIQLLLVCVYGTKPPLGRRSNPSDTNSDSEGDVALKGVAASDAQTEWMSEVEDFP